MQVSIREPYAKIARELVETGRYSTESEVVEAALKALEKVLEEDELRQMIAEGEEDYANGDLIPWYPGFVEDIFREAEEEARLEERDSRRAVS